MVHLFYYGHPADVHTARKMLYSIVLTFTVFVSKTFISNVTATTLNSNFQSEFDNIPKRFYHIIHGYLLKTFNNYYAILNYNFTYDYKKMSKINLLQRSECTIVRADLDIIMIT